MGSLPAEIPSIPNDAHVLLFAYPALGHMIPMLSLAEGLVERGCQVTYITSKNGAEDILRMWPVKKGDVKSESDLRLRLVGAGSDVPTKGKTATEAVWANVMELSFNSAFLLEYILSGEPLPDLATEYETVWARPAAAVCTAIATVSAETCLNAGLKTLILFDTNAYGMLELSTWVHEDLTPAEWKTAGSATTTYDQLVGEDSSDAHKSVSRHFSRGMKAGLTWAWRIGQKCHGVLVNSSEALEPEQFAQAKELFASYNVPLTAIGPLLPNSTFIIKPNALQPQVVDLLEKNGPGGTTYVSFGSFLNPPKEHLQQLAAVLKERKEPFIWSIRNRETMLPAGYEEEVEGFGVIVPWIDQKALLAHEGVGFVLSHMGWNSMLESCTMGKALLAWPLGFDQLYNSDLLVSTFALGMRFPSSVIFSPGSAATEDPAAFKSAINATLEEALKSPTGQKARVKAKDLGVRLRASLEPTGGATLAKDELVKFLIVGIKPAPEGTILEAVQEGTI
ncbi:UDP-Glycosyltransferase/glycogen phosphorylase [Pseudohyphozyma bogoriensis]|nr:UDP-Glycosyltransferase/glycogen phosphorylase [Pseudohyphozyma bogoriensis]